jgi:hypothetical protein
MGWQGFMQLEANRMKHLIQLAGHLPVKVEPLSRRYATLTEMP